MTNTLAYVDMWRTWQLRVNHGQTDSNRFFISTGKLSHLLAHSNFTICMSLCTSFKIQIYSFISRGDDDWIAAHLSFSFFRKFIYSRQEDSYSGVEIVTINDQLRYTLYIHIQKDTPKSVSYSPILFYIHFSSLLLSFSFSLSLPLSLFRGLFVNT